MIEIKHKGTGAVLLRVDADALAGVDLNHSYLFAADLRGADLRGAHLKVSCLIRADLNGANLDGADLSHSNLCEASLATARHFTRAAFTGACCDGATRWPPDFDPAASGAYCWDYRCPSLAGIAPDVEMEVFFFRPEEGGKRSAFRMGWRPQFFYDGDNWDGLWVFPTEDWIEPGQIIIAQVEFLSPEAHRGRLYPGKEFEVREGAHVVARGRVTRLLAFSPDPAALI